MSDDDHGERDRLASLADCLTKRGPGLHSQPRGPPSDAPLLQARVRIPESATDRREWLRQQSQSRRRQPPSSGSGLETPHDGRRRPSSRSRPRPSAASYSEFRERTTSRDSSAAGGESDTSSVNSRLSTVSTPEISQRQRKMLQQRHQQVVGPASVAGSPDRTRPSRVPHGSITRNSSS
ncbi:unnamed protein product, partial [Ectocarpus sp. 12 AP-2014]